MKYSYILLLNFCNSKKLIELGIKENFGLDISVLIVSEIHFRKIVLSIPNDWENNVEMKSDILFLFDEVDTPTIVSEFKVQHELIEFNYVSGAVILKVTRENLVKSQLSKLAGQALYKRMTIRNVNTVRKILGLMS